MLHIRIEESRDPETMNLLLLVMQRVVTKLVWPCKVSFAVFSWKGQSLMVLSCEAEAM